MVTASLGTSKVRSPRPSFTYTKTFATLPPSTTMVSAVLVPLQAASWLISILEGLGAVRSNFTVPLTEARCWDRWEWLLAQVAPRMRVPKIEIHLCSLSCCSLRGAIGREDRACQTLLRFSYSLFRPFVNG